MSNYCSKCGNYIYVTFPHTCPPSWIGIELTDENRDNLEAVDEDDAATILHAVDAEDAAREFWERRCAEEANYDGGKCAVRPINGGEWEIFDVTVEQTLMYIATPE